MKEIRIETTFQVFEAIEELPQDVIVLFDKAKEARENAYAPYSNFTVGAAILLDNNEIITGNNQENASYPLWFMCRTHSYLLCWRKLP